MAIDHNPTVFISYSWTTNRWTTREYKKKVRELATRLRKNGVNVILDQWDLRPGHDMNAFMEQSISDAEKVLILCERGYAEKANARTGGVGKETYIISDEVYNRYKQEKFIPVVMEEPSALPTYLKSRYAVFFTKDDEDEFKDLLCAIFDITEKPPELGPLPSEDWIRGISVPENEEQKNFTVAKGKKKSGKPELGEIPEWVLDENEAKTKNDDTGDARGGSNDVEKKTSKPMTGADSTVSNAAGAARKAVTMLHKGDREYRFGTYPQEKGESAPSEDKKPSETFINLKDRITINGEWVGDTTDITPLPDRELEHRLKEAVMTNGSVMPLFLHGVLMGKDTIQAATTRRKDVKTTELSLFGDREYRFGSYPQDENGKREPLLWRVLDIDETKNRALLITEKLIDCRQYHSEYKDITWEKCDLRKWMNHEFMDRAFTDAERTRIAEVEIRNPDNDKYGTKGGNATTDRVFALSISEAEKYFKDDVDRMAAVTPYAKSQGSYASTIYHLPGGKPTGWWWLRSPGGHSGIASSVSAGGGLDRHSSLIYPGNVSVRPALWLNL